MSEELPGQSIANTVAEKRDADLLVYNGRIERPADDKVIDVVRKRRRRKNVLLLLSTYGGDPDAAYRIARCLQTNYEKFVVVVAGFCKSAGTLIVLGANALILLDQAELGPLDVQVRKDDEFAEVSSGLTPSQALLSVRDAAIETFVNNYIRLKSGLLMTTKTAAEVASRMATGLYRPIMGQIDPMRLGEMDRAMKVAWEYGKRLTTKSKNVKEDALERLVVGYQSHGFVIDREEARELFKNIEEPTADEKEFCELAHELNRHPLSNPAGPYIFFMNDEVPEPDDDRQTADNTSRAEPGPNGAGAGPSGGEQPVS